MFEQRSEVASHPPRKIGHWTAVGRWREELRGDFEDTCAIDEGIDNMFRRDASATP